MIWQPDHSLYLPSESRFGPWYRKAKQWRSSLSLNAQNELTYGTDGHLQYSGTQGGHLMYGCNLNCVNCDAGTVPSQVIGTFSGITICTGFHAGGGTINVGSSINGTFTFTRNTLGGANLCFWEYCEKPGTSVSGTDDLGNPLALYLLLSKTATAWTLKVEIARSTGSCPSTLAGHQPISGLFLGDTTGSITDCSAPFSITNSYTFCPQPFASPIGIEGQNGSFSGTPVA